MISLNLYDFPINMSAHKISTDNTTSFVSYHIQYLCQYPCCIGYDKTEVFSLPQQKRKKSIIRALFASIPPNGCSSVSIRSSFSVGLYFLWYFNLCKITLRICLGSRLKGVCWLKSLYPCLLLVRLNGVWCLVSRFRGFDFWYLLLHDSPQRFYVGRRLGFFFWKSKGIRLIR
jgi:hypothetical protein